MPAKGRSKSRRTRAKARAAGFRSDFERRVAANLDAVGCDYDFECKGELVEWVLEKTYLPDFILPNGIIIETKGRMDGDDRTKHLCIREQYPEKDIRFLFQRDNPLTNKRRRKKATLLNKDGTPRKVQTYSSWCEKNGFLYAIGTVVPQSWIEE
jgi:hypothetical protein